MPSAALAQNKIGNPYPPRERFGTGLLPGRDQSLRGARSKEHTCPPIGRAQTASRG